MILRIWRTSRNSYHRHGSLRWSALLFALTASAASGWAQSRLGAETLPDTTEAVLDSRKARTELSCQVAPEKPYLGFDLRFHAYYRVSTPIKMLAAAGGSLQVAMRVRPAASTAEPVYLVYRAVVPDFPAQTKGMAVVAGGFDLGPGRYDVDWMMHDGGGRVCSSRWKLEAKLGLHERNLPLTIGENMVAERLSPFDDEPASGRPGNQQLRLKILLNLSPSGPRESLLKLPEGGVLLEMLRSVVREPGVGHVDLIAFNLRAQKIVYRQNDAEGVDFAALGNVLRAPTAGTVDYRLLEDRQSESRFVTNLLVDQLGGRTASADAIIIVGPKVFLDKKVSLELLKRGGAASCPIFYLNYNPNPYDQPFPDTISSALKAYSAASKYDITRPHDLGVAIKDMLSRLGKQPALETGFR